MNKSARLNVPQGYRRTFSVRAEQYRTIWRALHRLDWMRGAQGEPQDTCDRVVDAHRAIATGSSDLGSAPATNGSHAREITKSVCDGSYNESPIFRASMELGDSCRFSEGDVA